MGFALATSGPLDVGLDLGRAGRWDIGFEAIRMFGRYSGLFSLDILPFIGGGVGVFCGDPLTDDDNVLCTDGGVKANRFIGIDAFESPVAPLGFNAITSVVGAVEAAGRRGRHRRRAAGGVPRAPPRRQPRPLSRPTAR